MCYVSSIKPYKSASLNKHELINESFLIMISYTLFYNTEYNNVVGTKEFRYNVGWALIGVILFTLGWNVTVIARKAVGIFKGKVKAYLLRKKRLQDLEERRQNYVKRYSRNKMAETAENQEMKRQIWQAEQTAAHLL